MTEDDAAHRRDAGATIRSLMVLMALLFIASATAVSRAGQGGAAELQEPPITAADREHWAFQPLQRPAVPDVEQSDGCRNPIDRFILARLQDAGLEPMPETDRRTLLRRVTFDLTGLPPTPAEIEAFLDDPSPNAYEKVVDRLLSSSAYGERWAQHWLDLARFAETDGFELDQVRPEAWKYRDWVIEALNTDLPYDEFVRLQIAGDQLAPDDPAAQAAVRFLRSGPDMPDINSQQRRRHNFLNEMASTVGSVFLGLQVGCAQCHDHKYDPISQADFYRLRAFFEGRFEFKRYKQVRMRPEPKEATSHLMIKGDFRRPGPEIEPGFLRIVKMKERPRNAGAAESETRADLAEWLTRPDHPLTTRVIVNRLWQHHFGHGLSRSPSDFGTMGQPPSHPKLLDWLATELPRRGWSLKEMHRLMVTSSTYRQAGRPTNRHWTAEQQADAAERWQRLREADAQNRLLGRMARRRLEGEAIRDALLAVSDSLSRRRGGEGVRPPLPEELVGTLLKGQWPVTEDEVDHRRRSIYLFVRRNLTYPLFDVFDKPDTNASCPRRTRSTIAPQALMLFNSRLSLDAARRLSEFVWQRAGRDRERQVELCYLRALGREPTEAERETALQFLRENADRLRQEGRPPEQLALPHALADRADPYAAAALTDFCLALFNLNEFVYID